jgi:antitoxin (DNA-binding transcriptional repressor) of toxin-antitoxin stability system
VRENRVEYVVTYYGQPVAVILPIDESWLEEEARRVTGAARAKIVRRRRSEKTADEFVWE